MNNVDTPFKFNLTMKSNTIQIGELLASQFFAQKKTEPFHEISKQLSDNKNWRILRPSHGIAFALWQSDGMRPLWEYEKQ